MTEHGNFNIQKESGKVRDRYFQDGTVNQRVLQILENLEERVSKNEKEHLDALKFANVSADYQLKLKKDAGQTAKSLERITTEVKELNSLKSIRIERAMNQNQKTIYWVTVTILFFIGYMNLDFIVNFLSQFNENFLSYAAVSVGIGYLVKILFERGAGNKSLNKDLE